MKRYLATTILLTATLLKITGQIILPPIVVSPKITEVSFIKTEMNGGTTVPKNLRMRDMGFLPDLLYGATRTETTASNLVCELKIGEENILSGLSYHLGKISFTLKGYNGSQVLFQETRELTLGHDTALSSYQRGIAGIFNTMQRIEISNVQLTLSPTVLANTSLANYINDSIKLRCYYTEDTRILPNYPVAEPILYAPVTNPDSSITFSWYCHGAPVNSYQLQVLRLYNHNMGNIGDEDHCADVLDWSKALNVETNGSQPHITLTLAEGSGLYIWRVRPILTTYEGAGGNSLNWGTWSGTGSYTENNYYNFSSGSGNYMLKYRQFDEYRNWIYSRIFAEGDIDRTGEPLIKEQMTYANGLQQVKQEQVLLNSDTMVMASQTIYDYNGRPAMKTLPAPVKMANGSKFKYMEKLVTRGGGNLYRAADFDADNTYKSPTPFDSADATSKIARYYSNSNADADIPTAWGHPYTRTLFEVDGGNEARETSMPGYVHRIGGGHTTRVGEMSVSDAELLRMFGSEAPNASKVKKMITTDANTYSSVSYIDQDNKTIATCLIGNIDNGQLDTAVGYYQGAFDNRDTITKTSSHTPNSNKIQSTKKIYTPFPTTIGLDYSINPDAEYGNSCEAANFCATCDYIVKITVTALTDSVHVIYLDSIHIPSQECASASTYPDLHTSVSLPEAGYYQVDRTLYTQNGRPDSIPQTYYSVNKNQYRAELWSSITTSLDPFFSALNGNSLDTFYSLLEALPFTATNGDTTRLLPFGCSDTLKIPLKHCSDVLICSDTNYEEQIYDYWHSRNFDLGYNPYALPSNEPLAFLGNIAGNNFTYHEGDLNRIIKNMRGNGYTCDTIYNCFMGLMYGIKSQMENMENLQSQQALFAGSGYSFLQSLFNCTGTRYGTYTTNSDSMKYRPYKYLNSSLQQEPDYGSCDGYAFAQAASRSTQEYWNLLLNCLTNSTQTVPDSLITQYGQGQGANNANAFCHDQCAQKRLEISNALKEYYRKNNQYIVGEAYMVGNPIHRVVATDTAQISHATFLCNIDAMLGNCESTFCTFSNPITSADTTRIRNMFYSHPVIPADTNCFTSHDYNNNTGILEMLQTVYQNIMDTLSQCYDWQISAILPAYKCGGVLIGLCPGRDNLTFAFDSTESTECGALIVHDERYLTRYDTTYFPFVTGVHDSLDIDTFYVSSRLVSSDTTYRIICGGSLCAENPVNCAVPCFRWEIRGNSDTNSVDMGNLSCTDLLKSYYRSLFEGQRNNIIEDLLLKFDTSYTNNCLDTSKIHDRLVVTEQLSYYHYTLYYFDRAGNLIVTVPPKGVKLGDGNVSRSSTPQHEYLTKYRYNSLKQLTWQKTPDGDSTNFYYDSKGNMRFSVNARQRLSNKFSYTKYDNLYRIIEVGEEDTLMDLSRIDDTNYPDGTARRYVTRTTYNTMASDGYYYGLPNSPQQFIDNRVSYTITDNDGNLGTTGDQVKTIYSYDPHGNVVWVGQKQDGTGPKYIRYRYDLVSGSVLKVEYNNGSQSKDRFFHKYKYDADKRLREIQTSTDDVNWERQARYSYYAHGPLRRIELGRDRVQGTDYTYTIQGWLKGQNMNCIRSADPNASANDPGKDGEAGTNSNVPYDVFKMALRYYDGDFGRMADAQPTYQYSGLYNGNISSWYSGYDARGDCNAGIGTVKDSLYFRFDYRYDQLNRLEQSSFSQFTSVWNNSSQFGEYYRYDPNGNIDSLFRNNGNIATASRNMDKLSYKYTSGTNKLEYVTDGVSGVSSNDIQGQGSGNYEYDATGNLITDRSEKLRIYWTPYGKIDRIEKYATTALATPPDWTQQYLYDASGNRVSKIKYINSSNWVKSATYYVRDASGNIMAVYGRVDTTVVAGTRSKTITLDEQPIYGSDRIGQYNPDKTLGTQNYSTGGTPPIIAIDITAQQQQIAQVLSYSTGVHQFLYNGQRRSASETNLHIVDMENTADNCGGPHSTVSGIPGNNTASLYDSTGSNIANFNTMKQYNGLNNFVLLTGNNGRIMLNSDSIKATGSGNSVMVQKPGSDRLGMLFTVGVDRKLYLHEFDYVEGKVTRKNVLVDGNIWNSRLAVRTDIRDTVRTVVYARKLGTDNTSRLYSIKVYADSIGTLKQMAAFRGSAKDYASGLDISMSGDTMAVMNNTGNKKYFLNTFDTTQVLVYRFNSAHDSLVPVLTQHMSVKVRGEGVSYIGIQNIYVTYADQGSSLKWGYIAIDPRGKTMRLFPKGSSTSDVARVSYEKMLVAGTGTLTLMNPSTNTVTGTQSTTMSLSSIPLIPINLVWNWDLTPRSYYYRLVHKKQFEMKDHLGNVRAIVSDCKNPETANIYTANKTAEIQNIYNYYSFGMPLHRRNYTSSLGSYRFGYNGKEKDDEVKGEGNSLDFGSRIYDSRLGRWLSLDPEMSKYPAISPYAFSLNSPLMFNDPDGKKAKVTIIRDPGNTGGKIIVSTIIYVTGLKKKDATEFINTMNTEASALLKPYTYTDAEGKTWEISYQITYQEGKIGALKEDPFVNNQMNAKGKHNNAVPSTGESSILKSVVKGVVKGDKDAIGTALEESIHQLGFDDKYLMVLDDVTGKKTGEYAPKEGWSDDALTGPCRKNDCQFLDKNSENMGKYLEKEGYLKNEALTNVSITKIIDSDGKNQELKSNLSDEQTKNIANPF